MRDVFAELEAWRAQGQALAVATVVRTWGSAPRGMGAKLVLAADGRLAGSVSGGCVESAVVEAGREVLRSGAPRLLRFGVSDATAWAVGLACGGTLEVFVEPFEPALFDELRPVLAEDRAAAVVTVVAGAADELGARLLVHADGRTGPARGALGAARHAAARAAALAALGHGRSTRADLGGADAFVEVLLPPPSLVIVGGVHIAVVLVELARALGWRTIVVDPRPVFASEARFPHAGALVRSWPDEALKRLGLTASTAVAVLTHDPKLDDPALGAALRSDAFYVGALGGRATQAKRRQRLLEAGLSEAQLDRLAAPIGLDLGGRAPAEIALSVMAQVVAARNGQLAAGARSAPGGSGRVELSPGAGPRA